MGKTYAFLSTKTILFLTLIFLSRTGKTQNIKELKKNIETLVHSKSAKVGVAISGMQSKDTLSIQGNTPLPLQSVFKYHLALAVLHRVDQKEISLSTMFDINKHTMESYSHLWSPIRKKYPNGVKMKLAEIIKYTVAWSDNVGCDMLLKLIGGPKVLQSYLHAIGIQDVAILYNEITMQSKWENQYKNWTTAKAANQALQLLLENPKKQWSTTSQKFLLDILKTTKTGRKKIRGFLPKETIVAHKTGHSGKNEKGITGATNDIGIVFLPNGNYFYISVFVSDSTENDEANQKIIAEITKLAWNYFSKN